MAALDMTVSVGCPSCGSVIPVPVAVDMRPQGDRQYLTFEPDMTDLWAHAWSHGVEGNYGDLERS